MAGVTAIYYSIPTLTSIPEIYTSITYIHIDTIHSIYDIMINQQLYFLDAVSMNPVRTYIISSHLRGTAKAFHIRYDRNL